MTYTNSKNIGLIEFVNNEVKILKNETVPIF